MLLSPLFSLLGRCAAHTVTLDDAPEVPLAHQLSAFKRPIEILKEVPL